MKQSTRIFYLVKFILAFCSISYELLLAQSLAAFLENTVLRYSVTIGLYMFAMGCGALFLRNDINKHSPLIALLSTETAITLLGMGSVVGLFVTDAAFHSSLLFNLVAHGFIVVIGFLTGRELPLILKIGESRKLSMNVILAVDYAGAFFATIAFAFFFFSQIGLLPTTMFISFLNSFAGILLATQSILINEKDKGYFRILSSLQIVLFMFTLVAITFSYPLNNYCLTLYLGEK